ATPLSSSPGSALAKELRPEHPQSPSPAALSALSSPSSSSSASSPSSSSSSSSSSSVSSPSLLRDLNNIESCVSVRRRYILRDRRNLIHSFLLHIIALI